MDQTAKIIIIVGIILIAIGLFWNFGSKYLQLGKLPGDLSYKSDNVSFYFPLTTSIILSILLSVLFLAIRIVSK